LLLAVGRVWDVLSGNMVCTSGEGGNMFPDWVRGVDFEPSNGRSM